MRAVVIGSGIAGTAAAWALARRGVATTIVMGAPGATQLAPGVLDESAIGAPAAPVSGAVGALLTALGGYVAKPCAVATDAGVVRSGAARDGALLDVSALSGEVAVPRFSREGWDADALVWLLSGSAATKGLALTFRAIDVGLARLSDERHVGDAAMAARHDDPTRLAWLAERLRQTNHKGPWLLPPWLGRDEERATALSSSLGAPCGELATGLAGPSGFRFGAMRARVLAAEGVAAVRGFAEAIREGADDVVVTASNGALLRVDVVVLATGGLVGGGLGYAPSEAGVGGELPLEPRPFLVESLASSRVGVDDMPLLVPGSMFGAAPETIAWPFVAHGALERAGTLIHDGGRLRGRQRIFAAGDVVADQARTWLAAAASGLEAGAGAATFAAAEGRARSSG